MNDILLQVLSDDKKLIVYRKELNKLTGSVTATILLQQLIFHASKKKYEPFYKFIEPCDNELYRDGDSWTEELGFTKYEFKTAYKKLEKIGVVTKNINMDRVTFYKINRSDLGKLIMSTYEETINIEKGASKQVSSEVLSVSGESQLTYVDNINLDNSKIKEQRFQEEEERSEKLDLKYLDEFINETTNNKKSIRGNYISYRAGVIESLVNPNAKRHSKTVLNYKSYIKTKKEKVAKKEIKPHSLDQLVDIVEIDIKNLTNGKINGKFDQGIILSVSCNGIDSYEITYQGLGMRAFKIPCQLHSVT